MVEWVTEHIPDQASRIIDLGCGNGHLLLGLSEEGYTSLTGIDYSEPAIQLAKAVAEQRGLPHIKYEVVDLLATGDDSWVSKNEQQFDVILDKGTFDAISLNPDQEKAKEKGIAGPRELYIEAVNKIINRNNNGLFLITSCNWTKDELIKLFAQRKS